MAMVADDDGGMCFLAMIDLMGCDGGVWGWM